MTTDYLLASAFLPFLAGDTRSLKRRFGASNTPEMVAIHAAINLIGHSPTEIYAYLHTVYGIMFTYIYVCI